MSALPYLSDDEILGIVKPLTQPAAIMRWFRENGFPNVKPRPNGLPLISNAQFDAVTTGASGNTQIDTNAARVEPNVKAYLQKFGKDAKSKHVSNKV